MYYCKSLEDLPHVLEEMEQKFPDQITNEGIKLILQIAKPHFGICVKNYFISGSNVINYQQSLDDSYFDKQIEPVYGVIPRDFQYGQNADELDNILKYQLKKMNEFLRFLAKKLNFETFGLDFIISEKDSCIHVIDLNCMYNHRFFKHSQLQNVMQRYLNNQLLGEKKEFFDFYRKFEHFSDCQILSINSNTIRVQQGFIKIVIRVLGIGGNVQEGQYIITQKGGENHEEFERVKGFYQNFYGRVIELENQESKDKVYIVTEYSQNKSREMLDQNFNGCKLICVSFSDLFKIYDILDIDYQIKIIL